MIDPTVKADFDHIARLSEGDFFVVNRDRADATWLIAFTSDRGPVRYFAWNRPAQKGTFLFVHQPKLEGLQLAPMKPVVIRSRDGLNLHSYLTLPFGVPAKNLPMVLFVHGGPWGRDSWGYNSTAQWLANRGYACLQVNFRASTGYGKKFLNAGDKQWGLKMHEDLVDAVEWAVREGVADPKRVAIAGGSYGGYAALAGVTFTPELFACAVDIVGPSNLKTLVASIPAYWRPIRAELDQRMGNVDDPKDAELIRNASPLFKADKIVRPLLIGQGRTIRASIRRNPSRSSLPLRRIMARLPTSSTPTKAMASRAGEPHRLQCAYGGIPRQTSRWQGRANGGGALSGLDRGDEGGRGVMPTPGPAAAPSSRFRRPAYLHDCGR